MRIVKSSRVASFDSLENHRNLIASCFKMGATTFYFKLLYSEGQIFASLYDYVMAFAELSE